MSQLFDLRPVLKDCGQAAGECPHCKRPRRMNLYRAAQRPVIKGLPFPRLFTVYFTFCPHCRRFYRLNSDAARLWLSEELPDRWIPSRCFRPLELGDPLHSRVRGLILRRTSRDKKED